MTENTSTHQQRDSATVVGKPPSTGHQPSVQQRWLALAVVLSATFMQLLDGSVTNLAMARIQSDLSATDAQLQFVLAGYLLAYASLLIVGGRIGDAWGRRRSFAVGLVGFIASSVACAATQSALQLDVARVLQGITAALMLPQVLAIIQVLFPADDPGPRAKAFGMYGLVLGLPSIIGPFVGGMLLSANVAGLSWRVVFLINVPIGFAVLALLFRSVPETFGPDKRGLDLLGAVLIATGMALTVGVVVQGRQLGWPPTSWAALALGLALLFTFWFREQHLTKAGAAPLAPTTLFQLPGFLRGTVTAFVVFAAFTPLVFFFSLFLQLGPGFTPFATGLTLLPFALGSMIASIGSSIVAPKMGKKILTLGAAITAAGLSTLGLQVHVVGSGLHNGWPLAPALFIAGVGLGAIVAPLVNVILARVPKQHAGAASGVLNTVTIVAGAFGVAVFGVVFFGIAVPSQHTDLSRSQLYTSAGSVTALTTAGAFVVVAILTATFPGPKDTTA